MRHPQLSHDHLAGLNERLFVLPLNLMNIVSSDEISENGVLTSFASGTKVTTNTIKRKFLWRRLLYLPNGTERSWYRSPLVAMFTLSRAQIQSNSEILGLGKIRKIITQLRPWSANMQIHVSRLLIWIFARWSLANTFSPFLLQHTIEEHGFDVFTISETWLGRLIIKSCRCLDLYSSAKIGENINLVAALRYKSETHSKRHF